MKYYYFLILIVFILQSESISSQPSYCQLIGSSQDDLILSFKIGVKPINMDVIVQAAWEVADPRSPKYGQFWSWEKVKQMTSSPQRLRELKSLLDRFNLPVAKVSADEMWIDTFATVRQVEQIFQTQCDFYHCQVSPHAATEIHKCASLVIPAEFLPHIDLIEGLTTWPEDFEPRSHGRTQLDVPTAWPPGPYLDMAALKKLYNCPANLSITSPLTSGAVFEVNAPAESYNPPDLASYQQLSGIPQKPITQFAGSGTVTYGCDNWACLEPMLDVEMFLGVAPDVNFSYWTTNNVGGAQNTVLNYLLDLSATANPPLIHSMSWGPPESHLSADQANRIDQEFAKLCLRGLTFVASSGDDGVNYRTARNNPAACGLSPQYPAGSPWVTTVGGTFGPEYDIPDRTCQTNVPGYSATITSGGGFSIWYPQPSYQQEMVQSYLATMSDTLPPLNTFNQTNRAYPDVSLQSNAIDTIGNQYFIPNGGTSASAPLFAGFLSLILDARLAQGLSPFGALNPALYSIAQQTPSAFNDITVGDNHCTGVSGTTYTCCPYGFNATKAWDPVTGLGTINFVELRNALIKF